MAVTSDETVVVRRNERAGEPTEITVNCPDKVGLGCDLARIIFEFGLSVVKGDLSTDGKWCFLVFWVVPRIRGGKTIKWTLLKQRILAACPSSTPALLPAPKPQLNPRNVYLLQVCSSDRSGLLNDMCQALWEMELTIQRVNVSTSPDNKAVDLFFVTDNRDELPAKHRVESVAERVRTVIGRPDAECEVRKVGPEANMGGNGFASTQYTTQAVENLLLSSQLEEDDRAASDEERRAIGGGGGGSSLSMGRSRFPSRRYGAAGEKRLEVADSFRATVSVDNTMSPVHSTLQILAKDRKGLIYDCLRTLKDTNHQVAYGQSVTSEDGLCHIDMFLQDASGRKVTDGARIRELCARMQRELERPLRVAVVPRGPDSELLVCSPVERCGRGRPRVLFDVTFVVRQMELQIFKASVSRHHVGERVWEVYRFLIQDKDGQAIVGEKRRDGIAAQVSDILMG